MDIDKANYVLGKAIMGLQAEEIEGASALYVGEAITVPRSIDVAVVSGDPEVPAQGLKSQIGEKPSLER